MCPMCAIQIFVIICIQTRLFAESPEFVISIERVVHLTRPFQLATPPDSQAHGIKLNHPLTSSFCSIMSVYCLSFDVDSQLVDSEFLHSFPSKKAIRKQRKTINPLRCHSFQGPLFAALRPRGDPRSSQLLPPRRALCGGWSCPGKVLLFVLGKSVFFFQGTQGNEQKATQQQYIIHIILC